jgi:hypothetical protein
MRLLETQNTVPRNKIFSRLRDRTRRGTAIMTLAQADRFLSPHYAERRAIIRNSQQEAEAFSSCIRLKSEYTRGTLMEY